VLRLGERRVLVDYAHNPAAVEGLIEVVTAMPAKRRIGVLAAPGDRRDEDIRAIGRLSAPLDYVIVKEDDDRRGREPGEAAALIAEGFAEGGGSSEVLEVVPNELEAVDRLMQLLEPGDLGVILADDVPGVLAHVHGYRAGVN
jgi:cyanophycin synthetase